MIRRLLKFEQGSLILNLKASLKTCLISIFCICLIFLNGASAQAATPIPEFEEQVLQIIRSHPEAIIESVQAYQMRQQQEQQERQQAAVQEFAKRPQAMIGASPKRGSSQQVILVEFSDFQCPFCARAHQTVNQFVDRHLNDLTFVFKFLPLVQIHPQALASAQAAWAAGQQGKFWEYHDALFTNQDSLGEELYLALAQQFGLDITRFNRDRSGEAANAAIQRDVELAQQLMVQGTPFFVMNDQALSGAVSLEELEGKFAQVK